jgi:hypothetical protein
VLAKASVPTGGGLTRPQRPRPRERSSKSSREIRQADVADQVTIQSFDWGALTSMSRSRPSDVGGQDCYRAAESTPGPLRLGDDPRHPH